MYYRNKVEIIGLINEVGVHIHTKAITLMVCQNFSE